jgi:tight adherence protein C
MLANMDATQAIYALIFAGSMAIVLWIVASQYLDRNDRTKRMRGVVMERESIRVRERERLSINKDNSARRVGPKSYIKTIVEQFSLHKWLGTETAKANLIMAGYRSGGSEYAFLVFRLLTPLVMMVAAIICVFFAFQVNQTAIVKVGIVILSIFIGVKLPELFISNQIKSRQFSMKRAFPDALDLMLICVESGMSIEHAFRKVSEEIGTQSIPMAEELALTTAELSYLPVRRQAFENLSVRTGLQNVRSICTALIQAEKYGTPVGTALRVLAQENRDDRMNAAEKKAAALPPKLTVPMILFFLPVLFIVILTPALVQVFNWP